MEHTFIICAYKESPYLEECILSVLNQTVKSEVILSTSTPNEYIFALAEKYGIPVRINDRTGGIVQDWNFGYAQAKTDFITLAHQDDIYEPAYAENIISAMKKCPETLIAFTDYGELREGNRVNSNLNLEIKRILLTPLKAHRLSNKTIIKRMVLSLGDPICCPAVTFNRRKLPPSVFTVRFRANEDWQAWERLSRFSGAFTYIPWIGMYHRIHEGSETTNIIQDTSRIQEDYVMFRKFWPAPAAWILSKVYSLSEKSNSLSK